MGRIVDGLDIDLVLKNHTERISWGPDGNIYPQINDIFIKNSSIYLKSLSEFALSRENYYELGNIIYNTYCTGMDSFLLYNMIKKYNPKKYLEIGSGNSTLIARASSSSMKIVVIDPAPRIDVGNVCDVILNITFQTINSLEEVDDLGVGDILFIDSSHHLECYNDVAMIYSCVLPRLRSGVIIQIHDIYLPYNYIKSFARSEQYLLIPYLLGDLFEVLFPTYFVCFNDLFKKQLLYLFEDRFGLPLGASFWMVKK
jgi:predicted O-methyltransferase YrrM